MITATILVVSLLVGYLATLGCALAGTFLVASLSPRFVIENHYLRSGYKLTQEFVVLLAATAGGYASAAVGGSIHPLLTEVCLAAILVSINWINSWELRQRGLAHQILLTICLIAGVFAGYALRLH